MAQVQPGGTLSDAMELEGVNEVGKIGDKVDATVPLGKIFRAIPKAKGTVVILTIRLNSCLQCRDVRGGDLTLRTVDC